MLKRAIVIVVATMMAVLGLEGTATAEKPPRASGRCSTSGNCIVQITRPGSSGSSHQGSETSTIKPVANNGSRGGAGGFACAGGDCEPQIPADATSLCAEFGGGARFPASPAYNRHCMITAVARTTPATPSGPKGAAAPTYTPGQAATAAIAQLQVYKPKIGSAPCTKVDCKGTVGVPVWLWTQPWETQTATATLGPYTVTATAKISQIRWELGDGTGVTCTSAGTAYDVSMGWATSPDCGVPRGFQKVGTYAIKAVATWQISWTGAATGSQTLTAATTAPPVRVGEYQALTS